MYLLWTWANRFYRYLLVPSSDLPSQKKDCQERFPQLKDPQIHTLGCGQSFTSLMSQTCRNISAIVGSYE